MAPVPLTMSDVESPQIPSPGFFRALLWNIKYALNAINYLSGFVGSWFDGIARMATGTRRRPGPAKSFLFFRQARDQPQRNGQAFELIMRFEVELRGEVAGIFFVFLDHNLRRRQRTLSFDLIAGRRIGFYEASDPF